MEQVIIEITSKKASPEMLEYAEKITKTEEELEKGRPFKEVMMEVWGHE